MAKGKATSFDQLLANIWEKLVLGLALIITIGLIALSFTTTPKVDVTPEELTQLASRAEQNYKMTPAQPTREVPGFAEVAKRIRESVSSTGYQIVAPFDPPLFQQRRKRGQPPVFPVADLRAAAGRGAVAGLASGSVGGTMTGTGYPMGPGPSGILGSGPMTSGPVATMPEPTSMYGEESASYSGYGGYAGYGTGPTGPSHGRRWVVVTGIIEWEKQIRAFRDTFQDAIRVGTGSAAAGTGTTGYPGHPGYPGTSGIGEEVASQMGGYPGTAGYPGSGSYPGAGPGVTGLGADIELPRYVYFSIERAEVTDESVPVDSLKWEPLNARARWFEEQRIPHDQFMYVSPEYVMPSGQVPLTWPLVQLTAGDTWGKEVAHEPEIPFLEPRRAGYGYGAFATMGGYPGEEMASLTGPAPAGPIPASIPPGARQPGQPPSGAGQPPRPPVPEIPDAPIDPAQMAAGLPGAAPYAGYPGPYGPTGVSPMYGPGSATYPDSESGAYPGYPMASGEPTGAGPYPGYGIVQQKESPIKLFRFVDYKVEPGKSYRYRVKLWLANPNYKLPPQVLEDEAMAKDAWLLTEWSQPTNVVRVPSDYGVLAGPAKAGRVPFIEPRATVGVTVFRPTPGLTKFMEFPDLVRGTVIDFSAADVKKMNPPKREKKPTGSTYGAGSEYGISGSPGLEGIPGLVGSGGEPPGGSGYPGPGYPGPTTPTSKQEEPELDYFTRLMIVDLGGGEPLPNKDSAPSTVVLMDPEGHLTIREELEDLPQYKRFTQAPQPVSPYGTTMTGPGEEYPGYEEYYEAYSRAAGGRPATTRGARGSGPTSGTGTRGAPGRATGPRGSPSGPPPMLGP